MSSLALRNVSKRYGDTRVIEALSLDVADGQFVALVGPSGCGKSTLLRMIAGLESTSAGDVFIGDRRVNDESPKARNIAMVFQNYALYPHMSVRENMGLNLKISGIAKPEINQRVQEAAKLLDIVDLLDRRPSQLSGGQRQRVAMGRAIVRNPAVFLFDEPLSNLDAKLRVQMRGEIKALHKKVRTTAIYVTHDQIEAMTLADRVVVMRDGRIEQIGSPLEVYDEPVNVFVAGFLGSPAMNLLPGHIRSGRAVFSNGSHLPLPEHLRPSASEGRPILYGVRPQDLTPGEAEGLACSIQVVEPTGSETLIHGLVGDDAVCVAVNERPRIEAGATVHLVPRPDRARIFDATSGMRL